jgi:2,3-bisphosphoglycerate-independent phosphoglycerate mutase
MALFGYDPVKYLIGRGVLEALGIDLELSPQDIAVRGNFATLDQKRLITDRRAGRISSEKNRQLCQLLQQKIPAIDDVRLTFETSKEHRFVIVLKGPELDERVTETDPQQLGVKPLECEPLAPEAAKTARIINQLIRKAESVLPPPANGVLLRGSSRLPALRPLGERFGLKPAAVATYPMYRGLARLVGMTVLATGETLADELDTVKAHWQDFNFFFVHYKKPDSKGEDGDFAGKVKAIEEFDRLLPEFLALSPDVVVLTGDHSTPAALKSHSWHPNPLILHARTIRPDSVQRFTEAECLNGGLGLFPARHLMSFMLAHSGRLTKFGA